MKTLLNKWFIAFCIIWLIVFIATKNQIYFYWPIQFYLIDLIAVPIISQLCLWWMRLIHSSTYKLGIWQVIFIVANLSVVFEGVLPNYNTRYIADVLDVLAYGLGGIFYYQIMNK
jgi:hypothetical protein